VATFTDSFDTRVDVRCRGCERSLAGKVVVRVAATDPGPPPCPYCARAQHYVHPPIGRVIT